MTALTAAERDRFATWLEQEALTDDLLAEQMEKASIPFAAIRREDAMAKLRIARQLRMTEEQTA